jgi:hypothetical protein
MLLHQPLRWVGQGQAGRIPATQQRVVYHGLRVAVMIIVSSVSLGPPTSSVTIGPP